MPQGSEMLGPSLGGEPAISHSHARCPPKSSPRYVQQTLGKLKHDSSRIENNSSRYYKAQQLPEVVMTTPPTGETSAAATPDMSKPRAWSTTATPDISVKTRSRPRAQTAETPEPLMAEYLPRGSPDATSRQDCRSVTSSHRAESRLEPLDGRSEGKADRRAEVSPPHFSKSPGLESQGSTRGSPCADSEYRNCLPSESPTSEFPTGCWPSWSQDVSGRPWIIADMQRWRNSFHEEMQECVQGVRSAMQDSNIHKMVAEFSEWRESEKQEKSELKRHVEELLRVNVSLRQTQLDWFTTKGVDHVINNALGKAAKAGSEEVKIAVNESLLKAVDELQSNVGDMIQQQECNIRSAFERHSTQDKWRQAANLMKVTENVESHCQALKEHIEDFSVGGGGPSLLQEQITRISSDLQVQVAASSEKRKTLGIRTEQLTELLTRQDVLIEDRLEKATSGFKDVQATLMKDCDEWQHRFVDAEVKLVDARTSADHLAMERDNLLKTVHEMEVKMQQATSKSGVDLVNKLKEIERHGNITVNLKNGDVEMVRQLDFVPRTSKQEPIAEFADNRLAFAIMEDLAVIQQLFYVNMIVEGHTKGSDGDFFQRLADNRAALIKDHLVADGIEERFIQSKGFPGPTGLNRPCVIIRLDIFPDND